MTFAGKIVAFYGRKQRMAKCCWGVLQRAAALKERRVRQL